MTQTRVMSATEATVNVLVGFGVAVGTQVAIFPLFGLIATLEQNMAMGAVFTIVSLVRSYVLRRVFNHFVLQSGAAVTHPLTHVGGALWR